MANSSLDNAVGSSMHWPDTRSIECISCYKMKWLFYRRIFTYENIAKIDKVQNPATVHLTTKDIERHEVTVGESNEQLCRLLTVAQTQWPLVVQLMFVDDDST